MHKICLKPIVLDKGKGGDESEEKGILLFLFVS
jgi:hypothetical protein